MSNFPIHTLANASEASKPALAYLNDTFGRLPNIAGAMATSPVLIDSLVGLFKNVHGGSFREKQIQICLLTNAVTNSCAWAVAFHSALALETGISRTDVDAIRTGALPGDEADAALSRLARTLIANRGHIGEDTVARFLAAGFTPAHLLEVVAISAASTITNYTGNITQPELDAPFQAYAWTGQ